MVVTWELRAAFARGLAAMYGREVPAYETLVEVTREINAEVVGRDGGDAERLGSIARVSAERHGAIRVGTPRELAQAARVFAAFGMHPVGFYDLRDAGPGAVPVVSTAFRPIDADELARNPFRVFTSMLVVDDPRYFDADTQAGLQAFLADRGLFPPELLALADRAAAEGGLPERDAEALLCRATAAFALSSIPVERAWYDRLDAISSVAADIGGVPTTHLNHLTPRVLDIDELQARMRSRGIEMIDEIQGPPAWEGPDVLLRQTSFRALAEDRVFRYPDGSVRTGALRVRFGEVEQRGIALTPRGRQVYDRMVAEADVRGGGPDGAREVWRRHLPTTERGLAEQGMAFFTHRVALQEAGGPSSRSASEGRDIELRELVDAGVLVPEPIVYEDFLPRSAAGIFRSNLGGEGARDEGRAAPEYDLARLAGVLDATVHDPMDLYAAQQDASLRTAARTLGVRIISTNALATNTLPTNTFATNTLPTNTEETR
ncbi:MAG TPA: VOC family protein [Pseudonocardia sp.]|nr:VOC family protein [Pseudonocardia sp.]